MRGANGPLGWRENEGFTSRPFGAPSLARWQSTRASSSRPSLTQPRTTKEPSAPMSINTINVHQDTLEYTSEGLRSPAGAGLPLTVGSHNVVRITRPQRLRFLRPELSGFQFNSSFPTPSVLLLLLVPEFREQFRLAAGRQPHLQVIGHTDATGSDSANKEVSERRAKAVLALLTADTAAFTAVRKEEDWGIAEAQVMLRVLRCDAGPPDGDIGRLTRRATEVFQHQFNAGMFHRHLDIDAAPVPLTKELDDPTLDALSDAFVLSLSPNIDPSQLHPTHPLVGCSEFNPRDDDSPSQNRRVSLALYPSLPIHHERAPCKLEDHTACPVQQDKGPSCLWYREHFIDEKTATTARYFDLRWLFVDQTRVILSALTTAPEGTAVAFQVFRSPEISELDQLSLASMKEPLSPPLPGIVQNGVAHCEWLFGDEEAEHLDHHNWPIPLSFDEALNGGFFASPPKARVPFFAVGEGDELALSHPPLHDASRAICHESHTHDESHYLWVTDAFGRVEHLLFEERTARATSRALGTAPHAASFHPSIEPTREQG